MWWKLNHKKMHKMRKYIFLTHKSLTGKTINSSVNIPECLRNFSQIETKWDQNNREQAKKKPIIGLNMHRMLWWRWACLQQQLEGTEGNCKDYRLSSEFRVAGQLGFPLCSGRLVAKVFAPMQKQYPGITEQYFK